jgi:hypothetical protein
MRKIGATQLPVLEHVEPVAAAEINRRGGGNLHRPLGPARLGTPHSQIGPVARFGAIDREGNAIEIALARRTEQFDGGQRLRDRTPEHCNRLISRVDERDQFALRPARRQRLPWYPHRSVRVAAHDSDGFALRIADVTISAVSAFSRGSTPAVSSLAVVPPRMILTACHAVSGKETISTLTDFFSTGRLPITVVTWWCLDCAEALAAYPCGCISSPITVVGRCLGFTEALAAYPCGCISSPITVVGRCLDFAEALAAYPWGCISSSKIIAPGIPHAQLSFCIDPPTDASDPSAV